MYTPGHKPELPARQRRPWSVRAAALFWLLGNLLTGCAAVTNPVGDGIPVRNLPAEFFPLPKDEQETIPLFAMRQQPPDVYRLDAGDVLGIYIENVLGDRAQQPPVRLSEVGNQPPAVGFPIPVRPDGTLSLPLVKPIEVKGMTVAEAEAAIRKAYTKDKEILQPGRERIIVSLFQPRQYRVLVVRQDGGGLSIGPQGAILGTARRGTGVVLDLPAYENDVLNALTRTGGMPGIEAASEVIVQRGYYRKEIDPAALLKQFETCGPTATFEPGGKLVGQVVRLPLRVPKGCPPPFQPEDIILNNGDMVLVEGRDPDVFYTGGLLFPRQFALPRDYDLDVVGAVVLAGGPIVNGLINQNNLTGQISQIGLGTASPSQVIVVRRTKNRGQINLRVDLNRALRDRRENLLIQPGDVIILQETVGEALNRYINSQLRFNFLATIIRQRDLIGTANLNLP